MSIDIEKLHPPGVLEKALQMRNNDMAYYQDLETGMLKKDLEEYTSCLLCGADNSDLLFMKEGFKYVKCTECSLIYVNPRLNGDKIDEVYVSGRFEYQFKNLFIPSATYRKENLYTERLKIIESYIPSGKLLDVGAAAGHFMETALERGWDSYGVEISPFAVKYAREKLNIKTISNMSLIKKKFEDNFFDVVTTWDVLEHLKNPLEVVGEVYRILKVEGMLFVFVPNFESVEVSICKEKCDTIVADTHLIYFTPKTIKELLRKSGFDILFCDTVGLDIDHIIFNIQNHFFKKYDTEFINDYKIILQDAIDESGRGNWVRIFAKKCN